MKLKNNNYEIWFITGSQFLYGEETLKQVESNSRQIVDKFNKCKKLPCRVVFKNIMKTSAEIEAVIKEANYSECCIGIITFMHTFSPSKMWISGLSLLQKPWLHLHTQFNQQIPNEGIDMDYMNLHQSAHGDREHGFIGTRMKMPRKVVAGFWKDERVHSEIAVWMRACIGAYVSRNLKIMRFGDNMRNVAVTEGDKVGIQIKMGWEVNTWPVGELVDYIKNVSDNEVNLLVEEYNSNYIFNTENIDSVRYQAKMEIAMKKMLDDNNCKAFTNTFENLYGMKQLPGLATQRLMQKGYGYGGEGDWKVSAMTHIIKAMCEDRAGRTSFMEDYTYDLSYGNECSLGAHMLEVCPTIAKDKAKIEVHPLGIGDREDPARLVFEGQEGAAVVVSLVDMGGRLRMIVQDIQCIKPIYEMPNLPVARVMWKPMPNLCDGAKAWILAGGAHHTVLSYDVTAEEMRDFARIMDIEFVHISENTDVIKFEQELMLSDMLWQMKQ